jgi:hypothetical protein
VILTNIIDRYAATPPPDGLGKDDRLEAVFPGGKGRWRLLALFTDWLGPCRLFCPELRNVLDGFTGRGLMPRISIICRTGPEKITSEARAWSEDITTVAVYDEAVHRLVGSGAVPAVRLYDPAGKTVLGINGFDTVGGLDALEAFLREHLEA